MRRSSERTSAAVPEAIGAAMEVPLQVPQPPGTALVMPSAGAAMSTQGPKLEKLASVLAAVLAATDSKP